MRLVKEISLPALLSRDGTTLQAHINELSAKANMTRLVIADNTSIVVASTHPQDIGRPLPTLSERPHHQWRRLPIQIDNQPAGLVAAEFSDIVLLDAYSGVRTVSVLIALAGIVGSAVVAIIAAGFLTRKLNLITDTAARIASGDYTARTGLTGQDELSQLANTFDLMVEHLVQNKAQLRQTMETLKEREKNIAITLNSIADGVIVTDRDGAITLMNPTAEALTGWHQVDALQERLDVIFPVVDEQSGKSLQSLILHVAETSDAKTLGSGVVLKNHQGKRFYINCTAAPIQSHEGQTIGIVVVFNDVSQEVQLRQQLTKSQQGLQAIMDHAPSVVYVKDREGRYEFINAQYLKIFGLQREQVIGKTDNELLPADTAESVRKNDIYVLKNKQPIEFEENIPQADGQLHIYTSEKFPLLDEHGEAYALCGISNDITDRKRHEEEMKRAQKMDSLGKLTGGVAHDFNNILNIISGYAALLDMKVAEAQEDVRELVSNIQKASTRGAELTKRLLSFSSARSTQITLLNINEVVSKDEDMLAKILTVRISLVLDLQKDLWLCEMDASELEDSLVNLVLNAMHAIDEKGRVIIKTENLRLANGEDKKQYQEYVKLSVIDNGCGMDASLIQHIFDPFFSTKGKQGTGLGLSQVYGFVKRAQGRIDVRSTPGHGSTFDLYFPRATHSSDILTLAEGQGEQSLYGNERIVVVDDEKELTNVAEQILSEFGYDVVVFNRAEDALAYLSTHRADLLLSDIIMPGMDGYELAAEVMSAFPYVKVQLVSGYSDDRHMRETQLPLKNAILFKPYTTVQLLTSIRNLLD